MTNQSPDRLEIFLALALRRGAKQSFVAGSFMPSADFENESDDESVSGNLRDEKFSPLFEHLTEPEAEELKRLRTNYQIKTEVEKTNWRASVLSKIGTDEQLIDETVHSSHINDALQKEIPAVQKIIAAALPPGYKNSMETVVPNKRKKTSVAPDLKTNSGSEKSREEAFKKLSSSIEKTIRRTFARQFVSLRNLPKPTAFDRLSGTQLARLIRLSGIREVALACVRIEAVESVAAFLRRFSAEDARAVAAQLNSLRRTSESRLSFAESLVQTTIEIEPQPSAMLDLLGVWLIGIFLCNSAEIRIHYTNQKLPLEVVTKLPEIIDQQCRNTPKDLQKKISAEIEHLAETIARTADDIKSAATKKKSSDS